MSARSNGFCIGGHLFVEDGKCQFNGPLNEHADQDTFGRPISKGAVDLSAVPDLAFLFICVAFGNDFFLYRERQSST
jgi:hypothetical protein